MVFPATDVLRFCKALRPEGLAIATGAATPASLDEAPKIPRDLGVIPLMERVLSQRKILKA